MRHFEAAGVAHFDIVHHPARLHQGRRGGVFQPGIIEVARFDGFGHDAQLAVKVRRFGTLGFAQILVAAGQRQAVGRAAGVYRHDFDVDIQVFHKALNHRQLLVIFFAEAGQLRLDDIEKFAHHRGHAAKMAGAEFAAQLVLQIGRLHVVALRHARIERFFIGRKHHRHALAFEFVGILLQGARILVEIFALAELQPVDENAHHHVVGALFGFAHQRQMALVQIAHGGHKGHGAGAFAPLA